MANHPSALKRVRQTRRRTARNRANASHLHTAVKKLQVAISGKGEEARNLAPATMAQIDKAVQKGVLHRNAASRRKSHLAKALNAKKK
ncbi:MAG: 30S ribosomal protein S20 [Acidobacteria bacterium]|nr:MAG: 30S ribosomal protein S20 [Acidobacteriota bacterium]